ncbi:cell division protein FtsA [Caloranaerobacter azorensis DSM 13643]|uniref:Cell division protein FtsA n=1 Tax=Caloranaerobacter azorensis DSM 13643 TaxID=1121264 RepID=A0A1M5U2T9_9FIRM|nr:cell division protein FtsA [Caloranaerobacter azorensis]SHH56983.1 cell division protein FtsA [Caloranaerobacter azorensis DSM 13643]
MGNVVTSIDLGSSKICVIISEIDNNGQLQVIGIGKSKCKGIKKGVVVDIEETAKAVIEAVTQAENMADLEICEAYINIPGGYTKLIRNKGIIAVSSDDKEISFEDVKRVLNSATIVSIPQDQRIVDIIPRQYIVDGYDGISDPIGMVGIRLEVEADIIVGSTTTVLNLVKSVNRAGIEVLGIIMEPISTSEAVLTKDEKDLGVLLLDIGAGTSDFSVFRNGILIYSNILPIAGNHITNDISVGLRLPFDRSEEIKKKFGVAYTKLANNDNVFEINPLGFNNNLEVNEIQLSEIIEARIREIFELINMDLIKNRVKDKILTGIVITGGGVSYFKGVTELGIEVFGLPVRIGQPYQMGAQEPIFSSAVGLINYGFKRKLNYYIEYNNVEIKKGRGKKRGKNTKSIMSFLKTIWDEYF